MATKLQKLSVAALIATITIAAAAFPVYPWWNMNFDPPKPKCPEAYFEGVGDLPGDCYFSVCSDISADGKRVVGGSFANVDDALVPNDGGVCTHDDLTPDGPRKDGHANQAFGWTRPCSKLNFFPPPLTGTAGIFGYGYGAAAKAASFAESYAYGISADGKVAVGYTNYDKDNNCKGAVFIRGPRVEVLATLDTSSVARDISMSGAKSPGMFKGPPALVSLMSNRIIVGYTLKGREEAPTQPGARAVYWDSWKHIDTLPVPAGLPNKMPVVSSEAVCISDDGKIIGGNLYYDQLYSNPGEHLYMSYACAWKLNPATHKYELMPLLQNFIPGGDANTQVAHISGDGRMLTGRGNKIKGDPSCSGAAYPMLACLWRLTSGGWSAPKGLSLISGTTTSIALGTNYDGTYIAGVCQQVACDFSSSQFFPVVWESKKPLKPPVDIKARLGSLIPAGWELYDAKRISNSGNTVIGYGTNPNGRIEGWVAGLK